MTTINLHQDEQIEKKKFSSVSSRSGFFFASSIFICMLLALAGLKIAVSSIQKQNIGLKTEIEAENKDLKGLDNLKQVADMQARLSQIKNNLQIDKGKISLIPMTQILGYLGTDINSAGVFLSSYKYEEGNKISLTFNANSFSDVAKQVFNFKNSKNFYNVSLDKISRNEKYIVCDVSMNVK